MYNNILKSQVTNVFYDELTYFINERVVKIFQRPWSSRFPRVAPPFPFPPLLVYHPISKMPVLLRLGVDGKGWEGVQRKIEKRYFIFFAVKGL